MSKLVKICLKLGGGGYFKDLYRCMFFFVFVFVVVNFFSSFVIKYCYSDRVYNILYIFFIEEVVSVPAAMLIALTDIFLTHMFVNIY